jgi:ApeA N-terminal domain 1
LRATGRISATAKRKLENGEQRPAPETYPARAEKSQGDRSCRGERPALKDPLINARGYFWWGDEPVPEDLFAAPTSVTGALDVSATGLNRLSLDGILPRASGAGRMAAIFEREPIGRPICGILAGSNQYVRLMDLTPDGARVSTSGPSNEKLLARRCLLAKVPFSPNDEPKFSSIQWSLQGYEDWLSLRSIVVTATRRSVTARYIRPRQYDWKLSSGKLALKFDLSANRSLSAIEPVSATAKRKLENGEQRPAPQTRPLRAEMPQIAGQRLGPTIVTRGNVNGSHKPGNNTPETRLPG